MAQISVKLNDDLLAAVDARGERDGLNRTEVVTALLERGLHVPDGLDVLMLSTSQIASLDQTAARWELSRIETMQRMLKERILREFVQERQRQTHSDRRLRPA